MSSESNKYRRDASLMAERFGIDPELFVRLVERESGFDPRAKGKAGEIGLTQIMSATAADPGFGVKPIRDRYDPVENLRFGAEYLGALIEYYDGDYSKALMAYNGGAGNVDRGKPSSAAQKYATELLGGKEIKSPPVRPRARPEPGTSDLVPQAAESSKALSDGIAALFADQGLRSAKPLGNVSPPGGRYGASSRMSPLSGSGIPGLGMIKQYSTPGGVEALYRKK